MTPDITVITPTKNRLALLNDALDSVQRQSFANWEHLVVDDGSDDGTAEAMASRAAADPRLRFIQRTGERGGANVCRNIGLREARGEFIVFLDSDDLLRPHSLAQRAEIMDRNLDMDFVAFGAAAFETLPGDLGQVMPNDPFGDALLRFLSFDLPWVITGPVWRKSALERLGGLDETLPSWQDVDLHIRAITCGAKYLRLGDIDHDVRWQFEDAKVSILQRRSLDHLLATLPMFVRFESAVREGPGMDWCRQRAICGLYFFVSELMLQVGGLKQALRCWRLTKQRGLANSGLHFAGAALLGLQSSGLPGRSLVRRLTHKWKGWVRFRINPELTDA
jgi:glycosyltransferase involved in cell wall biosynthesis